MVAGRQVNLKSETRNPKAEPASCRWPRPKSEIRKGIRSPTRSIWRLLWRAVGASAVLPLAISLSAQAAQADSGTPPRSAGIYDPDPNHIWNRLFGAFYRQEFANNILGHSNELTEPVWVGQDVLDPPIGYDPRFLLDDEPFGKCNALLDEFLSRNGAALIHDPLKRALLQRDLWAVFDVLAEVGYVPVFAEAGPSLPLGPLTAPQEQQAPQEQHRATLERKLAQVIRSLALSDKEIENLPDTYSAAVQSGAFTDVLANNRYDYLPHDLFTTNSEWHEILPGRSLNLDQPILRHTLIAGGRAVFRTFVKLPANADVTGTLDKVVVSMRQNPAKPCFGIPFGTHFLVLREMISLDENGQMVATHVVESVQFRDWAADNVFFREAELSRALLFQGRQGGLRPILKGELRAYLFSNLGHLHDDSNGNGSAERKFPGNCGACHSFVNGESVLLTSTAAFSMPARSASIEPIALWKEKSGALDLLRKLMSSPHDGK
jgi:hypothetical protein